MTLEKTLIAAAHEWDRAMVSNDAASIGSFMADDWTIVGSDGTTSDKASFLALIESGVLTHDEMRSDELTVRTYGDVAIVTARAVSGGRFRGQPFRERELSSNVFVLQAGAWRCVLTHLSRLTSAQ